MANETDFAFPPHGHVAGLVYDAVNDQWIAQRATLWAYDDRYAEDLSGTKSGAGTYQQASTAVPAGEVWVIEHMFGLNNTGARGLLVLGAITGGVFYRLAQNLTPATAELVSWTGHLTLKEGDTVRFDQYSCSNGDSMFGGVWGYKMKVPS